MMKQFHPCGMVVCSDEKEMDFKFIFMSICDGLRDLNVTMNEPNLVLVANSFDAIKKYLEKIIIWLCAGTNEEMPYQKLCLIEDRDLHCEIMDDLGTLRLSKNAIIFKISTNLFLKSGKVKKIH